MGHLSLGHLWPSRRSKLDTQSLVYIQERFAPESFLILGLVGVMCPSSNAVLVRADETIPLNWQPPEVKLMHNENLQEIRT